MQDEGKMIREKIYDAGFALMQYVISEDVYLARFRDRTFEIHDLLKLKDTISDADYYGFKKAPLDFILALPNTVERLHA